MKILLGPSRPRLGPFLGRPAATYRHRPGDSGHCDVRHSSLMRQVDSACSSRLEAASSPLGEEGHGIRGTGISSWKMVAHVRLGVFEKAPRDTVQCRLSTDTFKVPAIPL